MTSSRYHTPVMLNEVLTHLVNDVQGTYVDGTVGGGGHASALCERLAPEGRVIGIDADGDAIAEAKTRLEKYGSRVMLVHQNTVNITTILRDLYCNEVHGILLDLGVSSFQLDEASKGFSFRGDERLDMRMDRRQPLDAETVVNTFTEEHLAEIIYRFGEEKMSRKIARRIVQHRTEERITTTGMLASIVEQSVGGKFAVKSLARVFQAFRIEVNKELERLQTILNDVLEFLVPGGRIVVISYHSLEDRIVKRFFQDKSQTRIPSGHKLIPDEERIPVLRIIAKHPLEAEESERSENPRSRSAKMRVAEKVSS